VTGLLVEVSTASARVAGAVADGEGEDKDESDADDCFGTRVVVQTARVHHCNRSHIQHRTYRYDRPSKCRRRRVNCLGCVSLRRRGHRLQRLRIDLSTTMRSY
jgi:hypothetical protein